MTDVLLPAPSISSAIDACRESLETAELRETTRRLRALGVRPSGCVELIEQVGTEPGAAERVATLRAKLSNDDAQNTDVEHCLLLHAVTAYRTRLSRLVMGERVLEHLADELLFLAAPPACDRAYLLAPSPSFVAFAKIATARRFPAGQLHYELSGIPLSWLIHLGPRRLAKVLLFLAANGGARRPYFCHHLTWRRKNRMCLLESEQNRSYHRIAQSLALHPGVKGLLTESWLHSPDTFRVSPHLEWLNAPFLEYGGLIVVLGDAEESCGVFTASASRKKLYEEGRFRPTTAMVLWPRAAMLAWASAHPEYGD